MVLLLLWVYLSVLRQYQSLFPSSFLYESVSQLLFPLIQVYSRQSLFLLKREKRKEGSCCLSFTRDGSSLHGLLTQYEVYEVTRFSLSFSISLTTGYYCCCCCWIHEEDKKQKKAWRPSRWTSCQESNLKSKVLLTLVVVAIIVM